MFCPNCGTENENDAKVCQSCGQELQTENQQQVYGNQQQAYGNQQQAYGSQQQMYGNQPPVYGNQPPIYGNQPPVYYNQPPMNNQVPEEYRPIGMWGYFGYELLFMIPIVGLIMVLIFSFGGTANKNLKNFARSQFCIWIVIAVLAVIAFSFGLFAPALLGRGGPGFTSTHYYPYY